MPFALDAFVFIVNEENPVTNLTAEQIRDVYSGKTLQWNQVGGPEVPIVAYQREKNSGSQELMLSLVMKDIPIQKIEDNYRVPRLMTYGMGGPYLALTRDKNGLAYSVYYYEHFMAGSARTRTIAVDGVEPTYDTIRKRTYPYACEVYAVTLKGLLPTRLR